MSNLKLVAKLNMTIICLYATCIGTFEQDTFTGSGTAWGINCICHECDTDLISAPELQ